MRRAWPILVVWSISLVFALQTGRDLAYNVFYLLSAVIALSYLWAWANVNWVRLSRYTRTRRSQVGKTADEQLEVRNLSRLPKLWLEVRDYSDLPGHHASQVVTSLMANRKRRWSVRTICQLRGRFTLGPMSIASGDPLGLFRIERTITATAPFIVYPATIDLPAFSPQEGQLTGGEAMQRRTHHITTNVSGVRDYEPGDSFNRIHWRSTARTGRLIVKEFELDPSADIWLFLDMDGEMHFSAARSELSQPRRLTPEAYWTAEKPSFQIFPTTEEYGVTVTASLAKHFLARNRAVGLISYARQREVVQADRGERQLTKILETLAVIRADGRVAFSQVLEAEGRYLSRHSTIIAVTASPDQDWVRSLRELGRRGLRSVAIVVAADTFGRTKPPDAVLAELIASGIPPYLVRRGDTLEAALSRQAIMGEASAPARPVPTSVPQATGERPPPVVEPNGREL
ncbi:MAG: DUF58 domain-containing protein [Anaerolineae bacterium]|nr:DUF58 domain-containing protein [Anaerolineae bacterium]